MVILVLFLQTKSQHFQLAIIWYSCTGTKAKLFAAPQSRNVLCLKISVTVFWYFVKEPRCNLGVRSKDRYRIKIKIEVVGGGVGWMKSKNPQKFLSYDIESDYTFFKKNVLKIF